MNMLGAILGGLGLALVASSCVHSPVVSGSTEIPSFSLEAFDDPKNERFVLELRSNEDRVICVTLEGWPTKKGTVFSADQRLVLVLPDKSTYGGVTPKIQFSCPGGCGYYEVEPKGLLSGYVRYDQIVDVDRWRFEKQKQLRFGSSVHWCPAKFHRLK